MSNNHTFCMPRRRADRLRLWRRDALPAQVPAEPRRQAAAGEHSSRGKTVDHTTEQLDAHHAVHDPLFPALVHTSWRTAEHVAGVRHVFVPGEESAIDIFASTACIASDSGVTHKFAPAKMQPVLGQQTGLPGHGVWQWGALHTTPAARHTWRHLSEALCP